MTIIFMMLLCDSMHKPLRRCISFLQKQALNIRAIHINFTKFIANSYVKTDFLMPVLTVMYYYFLCAPERVEFWQHIFIFQSSYFIEHPNNIKISWNFMYIKHAKTDLKSFPFLGHNILRYFCVPCTRSN